MAKTKVTGKPREEIEKLRAEWEENHWIKEFEDNICLAKIPHQPEDYDGPDRFCTLRDVQEIGDSGSYHCKFHGGAGNGNPEKFDKLAGMTHGMHATAEHLRKDFSEKDEALYEWITNEWPDAYDIDIESDPNAAYDFHRLATEIVRAERGRGHLIEEGEVKEQDRVTDEGNVVLDDDGNVVTEKSEHYLAQMLHRQDNKITKLEKELGISRKERLRQDTTDNAIEVMKGFQELGKEFISRDSDYDPDDTPWEDDDSG